MITYAMNELDLNQLQTHISRLAKNLKSERDLGDLTQKLVKMTVEAALGAELDEHLGYVKHDPAGVLLFLFFYLVIVALKLVPIPFNLIVLLSI